MRVYVIKNREGKYNGKYFTEYINHNYIEFDELDKAIFYGTKKEAQSEVDFILTHNEYNDKVQKLEIVKITIAEGDLEQQLAEKDKKIQEIEQLKKELEESDAYRLKYNLAGAEETIEVLKNQLAEKDKEIAELKKSIEFLSSDKVVSEEQCKQIAREEQIKVFKENIMLINQTIRHEICEKIREKVSNTNIWQTNKDGYISGCHSIPIDYQKVMSNILDQIEGENNGKEN